MYERILHGPKEGELALADSLCAKRRKTPLGLSSREYAEALIFPPAPSMTRYNAYHRGKHSCANPTKLMPAPDSFRTRRPAESQPNGQTACSSRKKPKRRVCVAADAEKRRIVCSTLEICPQGVFSRDLRRCDKTLFRRLSADLPNPLPGRCAPRLNAVRHSVRDSSRSSEPADRPGTSLRSSRDN